jgi:hypothetical protein
MFQNDHQYSGALHKELEVSQHLIVLYIIICSQKRIISRFKYMHTITSVKLPRIVGNLCAEYLQFSRILIARSKISPKNIHFDLDYALMIFWFYIYRLG